MDKKFGLLEYNCLRCGHNWQLDKPIKPLECPKCRSKYWYVPKIVKSTEKDMVTEELNSILRRKSEDLTVVAKQLGELRLETAIKQIKTSFKNRDWKQMEDSINLLDGVVHRLTGRIKSVQ